MRKPIIGITGHFVSGSTPRSSVVQTYVEAVQAAGGAPLVLPVGLDRDSLDSAMDVLDGLLLPGGDDVAPERYRHPRHAMLGSVDANRDELELAATEWALTNDLPVLGICRGVQVLAVAGGGSLYQDIPSELSDAGLHDVREFGFDHLSHVVTVEPSTRLYAAIGTTQARVNSFHHQAVRDMPRGFIVSARADDGVIEGIEAPGHSFAVGVQCHPEGMWRTTAPEFHHLFRAFVEAAGSSALSRSA
jgi:putative glutamine amidotransferase